MKPSMINRRPRHVSLLIIISVIACLNVVSCSKSAAGNGDTDKGQQQGPETPDPAGKNTGYMPDQKGTVLTYTIVSGDEAGTKSRVTFTDIHDSAGYKVAALEAVAAGIKVYGTAKYNEDYTYSISYLPPVYYQLLQQLAASFNSFTHQERPLVMQLPHKDPLHKIVFPQTVSATWHGVRQEEQTTNDTQVIQTEAEAVVDSTATIQTEGGSFADCIRVHYLRSQRRIITITTPEESYTVDNTSHFDLMIWMSRGVGPVRTIEVNLDTGIKTVTDLTHIEKPRTNQ